MNLQADGGLHYGDCRVRMRVRVYLCVRVRVRVCVCVCFYRHILLVYPMQTTFPCQQTI